MEHRRLGNSGLAVSVVGIGCNNFGRKLDQEGTRAVVDAALDAGITLFDTADIYGTPHGSSEEFLGAALRRGARPHPARRGDRRARRTARGGLGDRRRHHG